MSLGKWPGKVGTRDSILSRLAQLSRIRDINLARVSGACHRETHFWGRWRQPLVYCRAAPHLVYCAGVRISVAITVPRLLPSIQAGLPGVVGSKSNWRSRIIMMKTVTMVGMVSRVKTEKLSAMGKTLTMATKPRSVRRLMCPSGDRGATAKGIKLGNYESIV